MRRTCESAPRRNSAATATRRGSSTRASRTSRCSASVGRRSSSTRAPKWSWSSSPRTPCRTSLRGASSTRSSTERSGPFNRSDCRSLTDVVRRARPRDPPEHRPVRQPAPARVVEVENPADELARSIQARDRLAVGVDDLRIGVDAQAAEAERYSAGDGVRFVGRGVESVGPVALVDREPFGAAAVLYVRVEGGVLPHRGVVGLDLFERPLRVDVVELAHQFFEGVRDDLRDLLDAVLVPELPLHLRVEDLPGELLRLVEDDAPVFRVGVVAEVRAFVDEAL